MIAFIKGNLESIGTSEIVIENGGMGYVISVPASVLDQLPALGSEIKVFTYLYVREDILSLYGFLHKEDLDIFKLLITVNGIGPKGALGILSVISPDDLRFAVLAGDTKAISKAPGIGAKTAQRLIIDLKDKLSLEEAFEIKSNHGQAAKGSVHQGKNEAILALTALGYSQSEAMRAVSICGATEDMNSDQILKLALKALL